MLTQQIGLSNLQKELLKLYATNISDAELFEIKLMLSKYFADKAIDEMDKFLDDHNLDESTLIQWSNEHNRSESSN